MRNPAQHTAFIDVKHALFVHQPAQVIQLLLLTEANQVEPSLLERLAQLME
jgi:hypothetical protein